MLAVLLKPRFEPTEHMKARQQHSSRLSLIAERPERGLATER